MASEPHRRAIGSLRAVALDAPDIDRLATFYGSSPGWRRVPDDDDEWITLDTGDGWRMGLQRATGHVPPRWPDQDRPQQAHLDFRVPDIDAAAERAQQLGATLLRRNQRWHTLADPLPSSLSPTQVGAWTRSWPVSTASARSWASCST